MATEAEQKRLPPGESESFSLFDLAAFFPDCFLYNPDRFIFTPPYRYLDMRSHLDALVTEKVLGLLNDIRGSSDLLECVESSDLKNVCAKVSANLSDEIDRVSGFLGISKRRFLESAFVDAVEAAQEIIRREGLFEAYAQEQESAS